MIDIRPDLRNKFTEIESAVDSGQPVYLTKKRLCYNGSNEHRTIFKSCECYGDKT